jgi:hypothetical protein
MFSDGRRKIEARERPFPSARGDFPVNVAACGMALSLRGRAGFVRTGFGGAKISEVVVPDAEKFVDRSPILYLNALRSGRQQTRSLQSN